MEPYSWTWHPHPEVWVLSALMLFGYFWALRKAAERAAPGTQPATRNQKIAFVCGVATLFIAADYPMHDISEKSLYSAHMLQHMLFSLVMPPLLLGGMPAWMFRALIRPVRGLVRTLARPFFALVLFNAVIVITHWPALVNRAVGNEPIHFTTHAVLVGAAIIMWLPVMSPIMEIPRLSYPGQCLYLFLQSLVPTVPASFLTFGSEPLYRVYESLPRLWDISALTDQRAAGLIMKIVGGFFLWGWIAVLFFKWWAAERAGDDLLKWRDVDRALNRMELTK